MKQTATIFSAALASVALAAPTQAAQFGDAGTMVPNGSVALARVTLSPPDGESQTVTTLLLSPQLQYFVLDNLAIGAGLTLSRVSSDNTTNTVYGIQPSIAYNVPLSGNISLFAGAALSYRADASEMSVGDVRFDVSGSSIAVHLFAPVLLHFDNFFIGAGPFFDADLSSKSKANENESADRAKATSMGLTSAIGGWF